MISRSNVPKEFSWIHVARIVFSFFIVVILIIAGIGILMSSRQPTVSRSLTRQIASAIHGPASLQENRQVVSFRRGNVPFRLAVSSKDNGIQSSLVGPLAKRLINPWKIFINEFIGDEVLSRGP